MTHTHHAPALDRRRLLRSAAWSVPAVAAASATPAFASSPEMWVIQRSFTAQDVRNEGVRTGDLGMYSYFDQARFPQPFHYAVTLRGVVATTGQIQLSLSATNGVLLPYGFLEFFDRTTPDYKSLGPTVTLPIIDGMVQVPAFDYTAVADGQVVLTASFTPPSGTCEPDRLLLNLAP